MRDCFSRIYLINWAYQPISSRNPKVTQTMISLKSFLPILHVASKERLNCKTTTINPFKLFAAKWQTYRVNKYFVRCSCSVCGGMVSVRGAMVEGKEYWFCTEASRDRYESSHERYPE